MDQVGMGAEDGFTRTANLARYFVDTYRNRGERAFREELAQYTDRVMTEETDDAVVNRRYMELVAGMMAVTRPTQDDALIRTQNRLIAAFMAKPDRKSRGTALTDALVDYLASLDVGNRSTTADRVADWLKSCPLETLATLTVESLAEAFGYSGSYFSEKYRKETGVPLSQAIVYEKMNRAFDMLRTDPELTVKEVAARLGFFDTVYFSRLFRKKYGYYPSKFHSPGK